MLIYERIYKALDELLPGGIEGFCSNSEGYVKLRAPAMMDLNIDVQNWKEDGKKKTYRISMAHNFVQNGDVMADPDMEIRIHPELKMAEALTYQLDSLGIYQMVYPEPGKMNVKLKKQLNGFLEMWLNNIKEQGHKEQI